MGRVRSGSKPEELRVSTTSPLNSLTADIGADIDLRRFGPLPDVLALFERLGKLMKLWFASCGRDRI
jgi:hypothetical protein